MDNLRIIFNYYWWEEIVFWSWLNGGDGIYIKGGKLNTHSSPQA